MDYQLHRKPLNIYNYIPANSDHPRAVCKSIVHMEAIRLLRSCKKHAPYEKQCGFFASVLSRRGHASGMIWNILAHYPFVEKLQILSRLRRRKSNTVRKCVMKIKHTNCQRIPLGAALKKHLHLFPKSSCIVQPVIAKCSAPNLFRLLYRHTWHSTG